MDCFSNKKRVMIIAGETSGDLHGAKLVQAMQKKSKGLFFCGIGGQALKETGVDILIDAREISVVGITEVFSKIPNILRSLRTVKKTFKTLRPDLLILIDFPDFNLHVAATAKKMGIPVLYYISPQIWAWRPGRVKKIDKLVDHMAVILPFEEDFYRKQKIPVTFVGHPLLENSLPTKERIEDKWMDDIPAIGLLPGSRHGEIERHLPVMIDAARILLKKIETIKFIISLSPDVGEKHVKEIVKKHKGEADFEIVAGNVRNVFEQSKMVMAASGTVTLESAISGTPMVIIYKVSPVSFWLGKAMIRVKNIGLVNLIAGKEIVPELIQEDASSTRIADTVYKMLSDPLGLKQLSLELLTIRDKLGGPGASDRVADIAFRMLER
ncbi:MAG: lipid-A-disaccharide synthase [Desulfobacteraceae bacterium]|nr:lipid-A-disaccharide synthase [Desulfobacteraceae bacterium]MDH3838636.1 lipid-A-disaccharide synthase [Desulfobacteraceae bacterium]MDH3875026.1 lipid-A-disaccharide synthase [Desulfobacteraceae bacterium]MDH3956637.1 lipid-A-disaccharide synthase [Desulfobacteraceae bacterium]